MNQAIITSARLNFIFSIFYHLQVQATPTPIGITYKIPHTSETLNIDGQLQEDSWKNALVVTLDYETRPGENITPSVKTEVLLLENASHFYMAFKAYDPNPDEIRAYLRDRDSAWDDDIVGFALDTFNDQRRAFEFFVNPLGAQMDMIFNGANGEEDSSWNATWAANGMITDYGYRVEIGIPLKILRFHDNLPQQIWGIDLMRFRPRKDRARIALNPIERGSSCYLCGLTKVTGFSHAKSGKNLEIVPTLTSQRLDTRDVEIKEDWQQGSFDFEPSVDIRWGINANTTLNATLNPDFSQVETDSAKLTINNNFSLYYPERRPFFLDSADYFQTMESIVHTRNIGSPDYGLKLTNKTGKHTTGIFIVDDEASNFLIPGNESSSLANYAEGSENAVIRYRRDVGDESTVGMMVTHRQATDYRNTVVGFDSKYKMGEHDTFKIQLLRSSTDNPQLIQGKYDLAPKQSGNALSAAYSHNTRDWYTYIEHQDFATDFRADLGFIRYVDYNSTGTGGGYKWYGEDNSWWSQMGVNTNYYIMHDQNDQLLKKNIRLKYYFNGPLQSHFNTEYVRSEEVYDGIYYQKIHQELFAKFNPGSGVRLNIFIKSGNEIDYSNNQLGKYLLLEPGIRWNINRHALLDVAYTRDLLDVDNGRLYTANLINFRFTYQFSINSNIRLTVQDTKINRDTSLYLDNEDLQTEERFTATQLLYSYKLNPQTVFYLGYSDNAINNDVVHGLQKTDRAIFTKFSYQFSP